MSDDLVKRWDEYIESMGCVMGEVEHMAQQMRDRIEELEAKLENLLGGAETVLEAWDHHMRDVVVPASLHDAIEEMRADVAEAKVDKP
jgi:hypothetical protein